MMAQTVKLSDPKFMHLENGCNSSSSSSTTSSSSITRSMIASLLLPNLSMQPFFQFKRRFKDKTGFSRSFFSYY